MRRTVPEGHGPVRYGPPLPDQGLPVLPELRAVLAAAADHTEAEPPEAAPTSWTPPAVTGTGVVWPPNATGWPPPPAPPRCSSH